MRSHVTPGASVYETSNGFRLTIPDGDNRSYRVAQLDGYAQLARRQFPSHPPRTLNLRARASAASLPGTWGFGLWNDPFGLSLGFGGNPFRIPALPNAIWFFHASNENYLSFSEKPGNGFLAQAFCAPVLPLGQIIKTGLTLPFSRTKAREQMSRVVAQDGIRLGVDETQWHAYRFEWSLTGSAFWVDDDLVLETSVSPRPPLGLVIWIDNQFAAWHPNGEIKFGVLENNECWLEVEEIEIRDD